MPSARDILEVFRASSATCYIGSARGVASLSFSDVWNFHPNDGDSVLVSSSVTPSTTESSTLVCSSAGVYPVIKNADSIIFPIESYFGSTWALPVEETLFPQDRSRVTTSNMLTSGVFTGSGESTTVFTCVFHRRLTQDRYNRESLLASLEVYSPSFVTATCGIDVEAVLVSSSHTDITLSTTDPLSVFASTSYISARHRVYLKFGVTQVVFEEGSRIIESVLNLPAGFSLDGPSKIVGTPLFRLEDHSVTIRFRDGSSCVLLLSTYPYHWVSS